MCDREGGYDFSGKFYKTVCWTTKRSVCVSVYGVDLS